MQSLFALYFIFLLCVLNKIIKRWRLWPFAFVFVSFGGLFLCRLLFTFRWKSRCRCAEYQTWPWGCFSYSIKCGYWPLTGELASPLRGAVLAFLSKRVSGIAGAQLLLVALLCSSHFSNLFISFKSCVCVCREVSMDTRDVGFPEAVVIGSCESLDRIAENCTQILWKSRTYP